MNKKFLYKKIDLTDELPFIIHLDNTAQAYIESCIVDVVYESFIITGDQDYATARLLAQKGFFRAFFWAAAQAIEKYLKAIIVLHGASIKDPNFKGHPIKKLFEEAKKYEPTLTSMNLQKNFEVEEKIKAHIKNFTLENFISDIEKNGTPDNRYNSSGTYFNIGHLFALDAFCYFARGKIEFPSVYNSLRKTDMEIITIFEKNNAWFTDHSKVQHQAILGDEIIITTSMEVTKLDFITANIANPHNRYALIWLDKKMKLPKTTTNKLHTK